MHYCWGCGCLPRPLVSVLFPPILVRASPPLTSAPCPPPSHSLVLRDGLDLLAQQRLSRAKHLERGSQQVLEGSLGVLQLGGQGSTLKGGGGGE